MSWPNLLVTLIWIIFIILSYINRKCGYLHLLIDMVHCLFTLPCFGNSTWSMIMCFCTTLYIGIGRDLHCAMMLYFIASCIDCGIEGEMNWSDANEWCRLGKMNSYFPGCIGSIVDMLVAIRQPWYSPRHCKWFNGHKKMYCMNYTVVVSHDGYWCISTLVTLEVSTMSFFFRICIRVGITNSLTMMNTSSTWRSMLSRWRNVHHEAHLSSWAFSRHQWSCTKWIQ